MNHSALFAPGGIVAQIPAVLHAVSTHQQAPPGATAVFALAAAALLWLAWKMLGRKTA